MAHRTAKARRQRERALEPLPVALPTVAQIKAAAARLREAPQADLVLVVPPALAPLVREEVAGLPVLVLEQQALPLPVEALEQARERARDPVARALVRALEQAPTIRRRGGKLPVPTGRRATRRN